MTTLVAAANDTSDIEDGRILFAVLDTTGDTKHIWDRHKPEEVRAAEALFDSLIADGYTAFSVNKDGTPGERMRKFDKKAEKVIFSPALVGG